MNPLEGERRVVEGEGQDSSNVFGHYVSPCEFRVSNDPLEVSDQDVCETKIVGCVRDHEFLPGTIGQTKEIKLKYEYDLYYKFDNTNDNFWGMMDFLEGAMLEHVASPAVLDKEQCGSSDGDTRRRRLDAATHSRRYLQVFSEDVKKSIVAISSEAEDVQSRNYSTCSCLLIYHMRTQELCCEILQNFKANKCSNVFVCRLCHASSRRRCCLSANDWVHDDLF